MFSSATCQSFCVHHDLSFITPFLRVWTVYAGRRYARSCVRSTFCPFVRHEMYATTAQHIQTVFVGVNHNRSKHSYICMLTKIRSPANFGPNNDCTADKRSDLVSVHTCALIYAHVCTLTRYVRRSILVQIVNDLALHFQGQRFVSNTLPSAYVKRGL